MYWDQIKIIPYFQLLDLEIKMPDQLTEQMEGVREQLGTQWRIEAEALNKSWFSSQGQFDTALAKLINPKALRK